MTTEARGQEQPVKPGQLLAGVAKVEITNRRVLPIVDPLYVKALVLKHGPTTAVIVTVDAVAIGEIGYIGNDYLGKVRARIKNELGIAPGIVMVNASHCHAKPCADVDDKTVQVVKEATQNPLRRARGLLETARAGAARFPRQVINLFTQTIHLRNQYLRGHKKRAALLQAQTRFENRLLRLLLPKRHNRDNARFPDHLANHIDEWFPFLGDPDIPPTKYESEQAIRPAVVNRKVWGGNRTSVGAKAQSVLSSVLQTCKQQAESALHFISQTLRGLPTNLFAPLPALATR